MSLPPELHARLAALRAALDRVLVGQEDAKTGLLLALLAREHAYLEGPPGCGKSLLAEALARLAGARSLVLPFHRDIREVDLLGDSVLWREALEGGERLRRDLVPGPLLQAEVAILEDLPRAPGEALGPLLRILAERRALGLDLPLETAVGTGPVHTEADEAAPLDPLEPTQLDRFGIQVRLHGLLLDRRWHSAREVLRRATLETGVETGALAPVLTATERAALQAHARSLPVSSETRDAYEELLVRLRAAAAGDATALLSDRTFGRTAFGIFRAHAALRGAERVEPVDLQALRYMVARRLSEALQGELEELLDELDDAGAVHQIAVSGSEMIAGPALAGEGKSTDTPRTAATLEAEELAFQLEPERQRLSVPAQVERLMRALIGRIERGRIDPDSDPGGQPRSYRPLRSLDELLDGDLIEALLFAEGRLPGKPRTYHRKRRNAGGAIVILRDVSASMAGLLAEWAGQVVAGIVRVSARRRMRVGYVEFHHRAIDHPVAGRLLHRSYGKLFALAATTRTLGQTNYEAPLRLALEGLRGGTGRNRHIVMLTDGLPIIGDPTVRRERALAGKLGVSLHTVFLGSGECPPVLDELSRETGGLRFVARPDARGNLVVEEREAPAHVEGAA